MSAPRHTPLTSPVVDYEPPVHIPCPAPLPAALRRGTPRRRLTPAPAPEAAAPRAAAEFADTALRRILEVVDRRRPVTQLRPMVRPALVDAVAALTRSRYSAPAVIRRVRLRPAGGAVTAAEVFATYTRGDRVRAIAARVELIPQTGRWQLVALQIG